MKYIGALTTVALFQARSCLLTLWLFVFGIVFVNIEVHEGHCRHYFCCRRHRHRCRRRHSCRRNCCISAARRDQ